MRLTLYTIFSVALFPFEFAGEEHTCGSNDRFSHFTHFFYFPVQMKWNSVNRFDLPRCGRKKANIFSSAPAHQQKSMAEMADSGKKQ